jgi:hypothetical protein
MIQLILTLTLIPKPILIKSNLNNKWITICYLFFYVRRMGTLNPRSRVQELPEHVHVNDLYEHCFLNQIKLSLYPNFYQWSNWY